MRALPWRGVTRRVRAAPWQIVDYLLEIRLVSAIRARRYRRAVQAHRGTLPVLDESWSGIATRLREHGIAQSDLRTLGLPGSSEMFDAAVGLVERWRARLHEQARAGIDFLMVPANDLAAQPEIFRFGLHPDLLKLVETHIGLPVAYDGVTVQYTVADGRQVSTRDWHRDREDRRMIKLAIYLNDVDATGGPFELLPGDRGDAGGFYLREAEEVRSDAISPISCEGAAGTIVFADTARFFHRGKPATGRDRAAIFFSYFAIKPQRPYFCERSGLSRRQISELVEGLAPEQRAAALWKRALPLRWRIIPPAAL